MHYIKPQIKIAKFDIIKTDSTITESTYSIPSEYTAAISYQKLVSKSKKANDTLALSE